MKYLRILKRKPLKLLLLFLTTLIIYFLTSTGGTPFNHFVLFARSILNGQLDITSLWQPHLERAIFNEKLYIPYAPMPGFLLIPYVFFAGLSANQTYASIFIGSLNVVLVYLLINKPTTNNIQHTTAKNIVLTIFFAFSTNNWFLSSFGDTWYFSHIVAVFFLLIALTLLFSCYLTTKQHNSIWYKPYIPFAIGLLSGASFMTRSPTIFTLPFFFIMLLKTPFSSAYSAYKTKKSIKKQTQNPKYFVSGDTTVFLFTRYKAHKPIIWFIAGFLILALFNFFYNFKAFNTPFFNAGYMNLPGILNEPWFDKGLFHISYIQRQLNTLLLLMPKRIDAFPFFVPTAQGTAIWLTSPLLIFAFKAPINNKITIASWTAIIPALFLILTHGHIGMVQFGYRRITDIMPFLLLLTAKGIGKKVKWHHKIFVLFGIMINLWGVLSFKYGLAS